jgi:hypothetical protein
MNVSSRIVYTGSQYLTCKGGIFIRAHRLNADEDRLLKKGVVDRYKKPLLRMSSVYSSDTFNPSTLNVKFGIS